MPSENVAVHITNEAKVPSDVLARILARGGDPQPYRRLAVDVLDRFGSLDALARSETQSLLSISSLTDEHVALLKAFGDLVSMVGTGEEESGAPIIESFEALGDYVRTHVRHPSIGATLRLIMVDRTHRVVGDVELQSGTGPARTARAVVSQVLEHCAAGAVLLRVQASTRADFTEEFFETIRQVDAALDRLGLRLLDIALATPSGINRLSGQAKPEREMM